MPGELRNIFEGLMPQKSMNFLKNSTLQLLLFLNGQSASDAGTDLKKEFLYMNLMKSF